MVELFSALSGLVITGSRRGRLSRQAYDRYVLPIVWQHRLAHLTLLYGLIRQNLPPLWLGDATRAGSGASARSVQPLVCAVVAAFFSGRRHAAASCERAVLGAK